MQITNNRKEQHMDAIKREDYEYTPKQGFVLTHFKTVQDVKRSAEFYLRVFGGKVIRTGEPTIIQIANSWLVLNVGGANRRQANYNSQYTSERKRSKQLYDNSCSGYLGQLQ
jgi:hypothetical protein